MKKGEIKKKEREMNDSLARTQLTYRKRCWGRKMKNYVHTSLNEEEQLHCSLAAARKGNGRRQR